VPENGHNSGRTSFERSGDSLTESGPNRAQSIKGSNPCNFLVPAGLFEARSVTAGGLRAPLSAEPIESERSQGGALERKSARE